MKNRTICLLFFVLTSSLIADDLSKDMKLLKAKIDRLITSNPKVVEEVIKQNKDSNLTMERIKAIDRRWERQKSSNVKYQAIQKKACSQLLRKLKQKDFCHATEIFVCDHRGAIVCTSDLTSDYWQGDEAKWQRPFKTQKDFLSKLEWDQSSLSRLVHFSTPIIMEKKSIGVVILGLNKNNPQFPDCSHMKE